MRKMEPCGAFRDPKYLKETSIRKNKLHEKTTMKKVESVSVQLLIYLYDSLYQSRIVLKIFTSFVEYMYFVNIRK